MIIIPSIILLLATVVAGYSDATGDMDVKKLSNLRRLQGNNNNGQGDDRKMAAPCTLILRVEEYANHSDNFEWDCELDAADAASGTIISFPGNKFGKDRFESGVSTLFGDVTISKGKATINGNPVFGRRRKEGGRRLQTQGTKTVLALRVQANDIATTASESTISDEIFGSGSDVFNLASGFSQCSYNALNFVPGTQDSRVGADGVYTVVLNEDVGALTDSELRTKVLNAANAELGTLSSQYNHVMMCLPNIAGFGGIAYAYINSWLSVYKDAWCNYPSAQLHEIGHNIGLAHSGEGSEQYADQSGMMGYSYSSDEGPRMCFNNAKNWQLGWYSDRRATATPLESAWTGELVGFADYESASTSQNVILKVTGDTVDYYVGLNRATGINSGTREAANLVTIQSRAIGTGYAQSTLVAKLGGAASYTIANFGGSGQNVFITVDSIDTTVSPGVAVVRVYKETTPTSSPTKSPTKAPTASPTKAPTASPTKAPTASPTITKTSSPTSSPTKAPTKAPTTSPTKAPTTSPTKAPTARPSISKNPTITPTAFPTRSPTFSPTAFPTRSPVIGPKCSLISSAKQCKNTAGCAWAGGTCRIAAPVAAPTPTAPTPTNGGCSSFTVFGNKTCKSNGCVWSKGNCVDP